MTCVAALPRTTGRMISRRLMAIRPVLIEVGDADDVLRLASAERRAKRRQDYRARLGLIRPSVDSGAATPVTGCHFVIGEMTEIAWHSPYRRVLSGRRRRCRVARILRGGDTGLDGHVSVAVE